jgi:superfamily II DNA/RNA helicase
MREPQRLQIDSPQEKHANISQKLFWADNAQHKRKLLDHWLRDTTINQALVFASTQIECDGLANDLQQEGFSAVALHGALSQGLRNRRLMALRQGQVQILVATDVAARGIDVPTITHVFNFGLPMKAEDYTHRIGRTGRAGRDGIAVTFAEFRDRRKIMDIEHYSHQQFKGETIPGMEPQQRFPDSRPTSNFGGRESRGGGGDYHSRERSFGGGGRPGGFGANRGGFADRNAGAPRDSGNNGYQNASNNGFGQRDARSGGAPEGFNYERKGGFNDRFAGARNDGAAPRGDFGARKPAFGKPMGVKPGNGGKVFVPRDAKKRPTRSA